jgi:hypothetical protein
MEQSCLHGILHITPSLQLQLCDVTNWDVPIPDPRLPASAPPPRHNNLCDSCHDSPFFFFILARRQLLR